MSEKIVRHIEIAYDSTHYLGWTLSRRDLFQQGLSLMAKRQIEAHGDTEAMKTYQSGPNRQRS